MKRKSVLMLILVGLLVAAQGLTADAQEKKKRRGVRGKVKSVDTDANTITLTVRVKKETKDQTLKVAAGAKIRINGEEKTLGDIKPGTVVACRQNDDGEVISINAGRKKKKKD